MTAKRKVLSILTRARPIELAYEFGPTTLSKDKLAWVRATLLCADAASLLNATARHP